MRQELRGERTGIRYAIGARVRVQVSRVDLDGRKIDFRIVREAEAERLLNKGRKPATAAEQLAAVQAQDRQVKRAGRKTRAGAAKSAPRGGGKPAAKRPRR